MKRIFNWIFAHLPERLVSREWLMESLAGIVGGIFFLWLFGHLPISRQLNAAFSFLIFNWISIEYELRADPNGWSLKDVLMRIPALLLILFMYLLV